MTSSWRSSWCYLPPAQSNPLSLSVGDLNQCHCWHICTAAVHTAAIRTPIYNHYSASGRTGSNMPVSKRIRILSIEMRSLLSLQVSALLCYCLCIHKYVHSYCTAAGLGFWISHSIGPMNYSTTDYSDRKQIYWILRALFWNSKYF